jgi:beta-phosphoglucomutase-like phosphatase (HAD superfamily)
MFIEITEDLAGTLCDSCRLGHQILNRAVEIAKQEIPDEEAYREIGQMFRPGEDSIRNYVTAEEAAEKLKLTLEVLRSLLATRRIATA